MNYTLKELLDIPRLRELLDSLEQISTMPSAILDTEGNILTATAWQDICTKFHRVNPATEKMCIESDRSIRADLDKQATHIVYRCPMGLVDAATPIIIEGKHLGNVFVGQFFLEQPSEAYFKSQAGRFGFDQNEYLTAMRMVPLFSEETLHKNLTFIHGLTQMLAEQGLHTKRQCESEINLREAEWKFKALFENGPIGVAYHSMIYDNAGKPVDYLFLDANSRYIELTGVDPRGKTVIQAFPGIENDPFDWIETFGAVARLGDTVRFEQYLQSNDRWYDCVGYQYKPDHFVAAFLEITERKRAEAELKAAREFHETALNSLPGVFYIISPSFNFLHWNQNFEKVTGYSVEELGEMSPLDLFSGLDRDLISERIQEVFRNGESDAEAELVSKSGKHIPYHFTGRKILIEGLDCLIGMGIDITERRKLEKEQLKIAKLESLGVLAGGIAHDFNNILTGIMGNISFAQMFIDHDHKSHKALLEAEKASVRATELAHQLLTFARGGEPVKKVVAPGQIINDAVSLVLRGSNVKAAVTIDELIHAIEADEGQISQVFHNIIINATQAMPGGGTLVISARNETLEAQNPLSLAPGEYVSISFADQGCGISAEDLKRIFDPYFTTKSAGNGLGLASANSIVNRHGGRIEVISAIGKGSTFTVHLPSRGVPYSMHQTGAASQASGVHGGGSILVMDDEQMIRDMTTDMLEYLGYSVTTCENGSEAIDAYKSALKSVTPFSAIIMDLTIPGGLGGKETAQQILAFDPQACMIVSSGYSNDPIMSDYSKYGFKGAVAKPYKITELGQLLNSLLLLQP